MPLILTLTHLGGTGNRESRTVSKPTFTIGRASGNDWILPDPDRHLSKTHCLISFEGGRYGLTDVSTNGVFVNGSRQAAGRDAFTILSDGDEFRLGDYSISVAESADEERTVFGGGGAGQQSPFGAPFGSGLSGGGFGSTPDPFGDGAVGAYARDSGPLDVDPLLDPFGAPSSPAFHHPQVHMARTERAIDPFDALDEESERGRALDDDDLFTPKESAWKGPLQPDNVDAQHHAFEAPKVIATPTFSDSDFDDLLGDLPPPGSPMPATPSPQARGPGAPPPPVHTAPSAAFDLDDLSLDDLLGDTPPAPAAAPTPATSVEPAAPTPSAPVATPAAPPAATPVEAPNPFDEGDLDALFATPPSRPVASQPEPAAVPPAPAFVPPPPAAAASAEDAVTVASTAAPSPRAAASSDAALWSAFLEGAGMADLKAGHDDPEAAIRAAGKLFRVMVEGLREVLMSRAAIKSEMRVEQTVIRARDNNALKFSITADEAVAAMLMPDRAGYKPPLDASREAFADIKSHELAVMAGMQTALMSLLKRFDPESIEKRLQPGKLDGFLPGARKARIWELFCATYKDLAKEAEDDFQSVFGNEFARAYDAQMRKL